MTSTGKCIGCGAGLDIGGKRRVICPYCGTANIIDKTPPRSDAVVCAQCGRENSPDSEHCSECGADLYYVCPKCSTRNTADAIHCKKCGVNLADEIRSWRMEQAQKQEILQEKKTKQKKRRKIILIILFIWLLLACILYASISAQTRKSLSEANATSTWVYGERYAAQTATAAYLYENYPFKWVSSDGLLEVRLSPSLKNSDGTIYFITSIYNHTDSRCAIPEADVYAIDDTGQVYANKYSQNNKIVYVEAGEKHNDANFLTPWLSVNAKKLTIIYPPYCDYTGIQIVVDLMSSEITIK